MHLIICEITDVPFNERRYERSMSAKDLERATDSRQKNLFHLPAQQSRLWRIDFQQDFFFSVYVLLFYVFKKSLSFLDGIFYGSYIEEGLFWKIIHFTIQNHFKSLDRIFYIHHHTRHTGKLFCHKEWL